MVSSQSFKGFIRVDKLNQTPKNLPAYDESFLSSHGCADRNALDYIRVAFADDAAAIEQFDLAKRATIQTFWDNTSNVSRSDLQGILRKIVLDQVTESDSQTFYPINTRYGGLRGFFDQNAWILELGSGEGIALTQFDQGLTHKGIELVGIDKGYQNDRYFSKKRLRFWNDDYEKLQTIPNSSVNRFLMVQSAFLYGDIGRTVDQVTRVAAPGAVLRAYPGIGHLTDPILGLISNNWELYTFSKGGLAAKFNG